MYPQNPNPGHARSCLNCPGPRGGHNFYLHSPSREKEGSHGSAGSAAWSVGAIASWCLPRMAGAVVREGKGGGQGEVGRLVLRTGPLRGGHPGPAPNIRPAATPQSLPCLAGAEGLPKSEAGWPLLPDGPWRVEVGAPTGVPSWYQYRLRGEYHRDSLRGKGGFIQIHSCQAKDLTISAIRTAPPSPYRISTTQYAPLPPRASHSFKHGQLTLLRPLSGAGACEAGRRYLSSCCDRGAGVGCDLVVGSTSWGRASGVPERREGYIIAHGRPSPEANPRHQARPLPPCTPEAQKTKAGPRALSGWPACLLPRGGRGGVGSIYVVS